MNWIKILKITLWVGSICSVFVLTGFINHNIKDEKCREVIIQIEDKNYLGFISEGDVLDLLNKEFKTPISQKIGDIDAFAIEKRLNHHP